MCRTKYWFLSAAIRNERKLGQTTDSPNRYQDMINFVQKNGLKIHGFAVSAKKKALLELYKEDVVSYIQTTPQN